MAAGESSDEDYMSDAVLAKCNDERPGLVPERVAKLYKIEAQHRTANTLNKQQNVPQKVLETEKRNEGLQNALGSANKGFRLLEKMGYKPGMSIGKGDKGNLEPIPIEVKSDRLGLGEKTERKRKEMETREMRAAMARKRQRHEKEWKHNIRAKFADRETEKDLSQSQKVCEQLDSENGVAFPIHQFFWPSHFLPVPDEDEEDERPAETEDESLGPTERLALVTEYLRQTYFYCVWCGTKFESEVDLAANCPGNSADDH